MYEAIVGLSHRAGAKGLKNATAVRDISARQHQVMPAQSLYEAVCVAAGGEVDYRASCPGRCPVSYALICY